MIKSDACQTTFDRMMAYEMGEYYKTKSYRRDIDIALAHVAGAEALRGRKILVTGAGGLIGSFAVDTLIASGAHVTAAGRDTDRLRKRFSEKSADGDSASGACEFMHYDLFGDLDIDDSFDCIIHTAGYGHPAAFAKDPIGVLDGAYESTKRLLEFIKRHNSGSCRLLYVSSGEVYGGIDSMSPRACYPIGKQAAECLCASYGAMYGLDTVTVRLCHTFGAGISENDNRAASQFIRDAAAGADIILKSRGEQKRSYLYVADAVSAMLTVLINAERGQAYDIASDRNIITISELAKTIADTFGASARYEIPSEQEVSQQSPIMTQVLNGAKLSALGWESAYSVADGVEAVYSMVH